MHLFDLHTHFLPGLDDGPATLDGTVETLRRAHAAGVRGAVATPHMFAPLFDCPLSRVREVFERTLEELERRRGDGGHAFLGDMELALGAENYLSTEFLDALERGAVQPLHRGRSLLVEFNPYLSFEVMQAALERVHGAGFVPVLAHVERYRVLRRDPARLAELTVSGCVAQVNCDSVLETAPGRTRRAVFELLGAGLVQVVASDSHNAGLRCCRLDEAAAALGERFPEEKVRSWMAGTPRRLAGLE